MSRREEAKAERRRRIIAAARDLIRETGDAGLSMRALAARAGVSLATPYNLFGSKRAIVLAVLNDIKDFHTRFRGRASTDPVTPIFDAARLQISYYQADPVFYRTLWTEVFNVGGSEARHALWTAQRAEFWQALLSEAQRAGALMPEVDVRLLLQELDFTFRSGMLHWILGELAIERLHVAVCYGYGLVLRGAATPEWSERLKAHVLSFQAELKPVVREPEPA
jgi:AcrR family transcriptional regulator